MNHSKLFVVSIAIIIIAIALAGFLYLQGEITGLQKAGHPTATPLPVVTASPASSPSPNHILSSTENSTTATYDGTTLVCTWSLGVNNPYAVIFLGNGSNSRLYFNSINVTNVGNVTAYVTGIRFQTYSSNGTQLSDSTVPLITSENEFLPLPPLTLLPGNSFGVGFTQRDLEKYPNINNIGSDTFAAYTITPVWSGTAPS